MTKAGKLGEYIGYSLAPLFHVVLFWAIFLFTGSIANIFLPEGVVAAWLLAGMAGGILFAFICYVIPKVVAEIAKLTKESGE